jgi:hypothetical protein
MPKLQPSRLHGYVLRLPGHENQLGTSANKAG